MVKGFYLAVTKELQAIGYRHVTNAKGSHEKWMRDKQTLIVPRHLNSRFTANDIILKEAGSDRRV